MKAAVFHAAHRPLEVTEIPTPEAGPGQVLVKAGFLYTGDLERKPCAARGGRTMATRMMVWLA